MPRENWVFVVVVGSSQLATLSAISRVSLYSSDVVRCKAMLQNFLISSARSKRRISARMERARVARRKAMDCLAGDSRDKPENDDVLWPGMTCLVRISQSAMSMWLAKPSGVASCCNKGLTVMSNF